jgi:hypothetical protein
LRGNVLPRNDHVLVKSHRVLLPLWRRRPLAAEAGEGRWI